MERAPILKSLIVLGLGIPSFSCKEGLPTGSKPKKTSSGPSIEGLWRGIQSVRLSQNNADGPVSTEVKKVFFEFNNKQEFWLKLEDQGKEEAKGSYTTLAHTKNLLLDINESGVPALGLGGMACDFSFEQIEDELILKSERIHYKLQKTDQRPDNSVALPFKSKWEGVDPQGNYWTLEFPEADRFRATVKKTQSGRGVFIEGSMKAVESGGEGFIKAHLHVERSEPTKPFDDFRIEIKQDAMQLFQANPQGQKANEQQILELGSVHSAFDLIDQEIE